jgi:hypothetical protein
MTKQVKVLCVHGVNANEEDTAAQAAWVQAIEAGFRRAGKPVEVQATFLRYNDIFARHPITFAGTLEAVAKLGGSGFVHGIGDLFRARGMKDTIRWTAGMVVQWAENEALRGEACIRFIEAVEQDPPDLIVAHSLGSLVAYDALTHPSHPESARSATLITLGSQIGAPFVRGQFGGRLVMPDCRRWVHLYNRYDNVFTAPIRLDAQLFTQVETTFDIPGLLDHDAVSYLSDDQTAELWSLLADRPAGVRLVAREGAKPRRPARSEPIRRALLVGINDYPRKEDRLEGSVNDVFLFSSVLQECGFQAEDIRVVLNERATAKGIMDRLEWLLDGAGKGDQRVFYYSGHGAQIPAYGADEKVDHQDECLVPYDFDWTRERAVVDDAIHGLYSQLPYDTRFAMVLDCCHSGGMTRGDSLARIRGLTPPDDIRHRMLRWDMEHEMWISRELKAVNQDLLRKPEYTGQSGSVRRLGRSGGLLPLEDRTYDRVTRAYGHRGPYLPLIIQACREQEYSYEYKHGVTSYGAFTYSLARILRRIARQGRPPTYAALVKLTAAELKELGYDQHPVILGPKTVVSASVPWRAGRQ